MSALHQQVRKWSWFAFAVAQAIIAAGVLTWLLQGDHMLRHHEVSSAPLATTGFSLLVGGGFLAGVTLTLLLAVGQHVWSRTFGSMLTVLGLVVSLTGVALVIWRHHFVFGWSLGPHHELMTRQMTMPTIVGVLALGGALIAGGLFLRTAPAPLRLKA